MRRSILPPPAVLAVFASLVAFTPRPAQAATGIGLAWDHCQGEVGAIQNKEFACDTNAGVDIAYGTVTLAVPLSKVGGFDLSLGIAAASPSLPAWWQLVSPGSCRSASLSAPQLVDPTASVCEDWGHGVASGLLSGTDILELCVGSTPPPNKMGLTVGAFAPIESPQDLAAGQEYFLFSLRLNHAKTVGTGSCAGCETPVCITFCGGRLSMGGATTSTSTRRLRSPAAT